MLRTNTPSISFMLKRNHPYYSLTMFIPIFIMTLLTPCGIIIPMRTGMTIKFQVDTVGNTLKLDPFQVTILLTMVIYIDVLKHNIPVFDSFGNTPLLLIYFVVTICLICLNLLVSTHTSFLYYVDSYESKNFSKTEAKVSCTLAKIFNVIGLNIWVIDIPG